METCVICPDNYENRDEHLIGHDYLLFRCKVCPLKTERRQSTKNFVTFQEAQEHMAKSHFIDGEEKWKQIIFPSDLRAIRCDLCLKEMLSRGRSSFDHHNVLEHSSALNVSATFFCRICDFFTIKHDEWVAHFQPNFSVCSKYPELKQKKEIALKTIGNTKIKAFLLKDQKNIEVQHKKDLTRRLSTKVICFFCRKEFDQQAELASHIKDAHYQQLFRCTFCPFQCNSFHTMKRHLTTSHTTKEGQYLLLPKDLHYLLCPYCKFIHLSHSSVMDHISNFHEMRSRVKQGLVRLMVKCRLCNQICHSRESFRDHFCSKIDRTSFISLESIAV